MAHSTAALEQDATDSFSCLLCDASAVSSTEMDHHIKHSHCADSYRLAEATLFCHSCEFSTTRRSDLLSHMKLEHCELSVCPLCDSNFVCAEEFQIHLMESHAEDEQCSGQDDDAALTMNGSPDGAGPCGIENKCDQNSLSRKHTNKHDNYKHTNVSDDKQGVQSLISGVSISKGTPKPEEASLRLSDCPVDCSLEQQQCEHSEDTVIGKHLEGSDDESNLSVILGPSADSITDQSDSADTTKFIVHHGGARPKIKNDLHAVSLTRDAMDMHKFRRTVDTSSTCATERKESEGFVDSIADGDKTFYCPLCPFQTFSEGRIQHHVNEKHMMEGEDDLEAGLFVFYSCPFCAKGFDTPSDLSEHIGWEHPDGESGGGSSISDLSPVTGPEMQSEKNSKTSGRHTSNFECPVCGMVLKDETEVAMSLHVSKHFEFSATSQGQVDEDWQTALSLQKQEDKEQRKDEQKFQEFQAQHGMDNSMTAKQQFEKDVENAAYKGEITTSEFHQKKIVYAQSSRSGLDDGSTQVPGVIERLQCFYDSRNNLRNVTQAVFCSSTDHYSGSYGDRGWGCGYRNLQMILSCLMREPKYLQVLFNGQARIPSIQKLQQLIESAWQSGFDAPGCRQLGGRIVNTRKWIGTTEIVAMLSSLGIKCEVVDFTKPSGPNNTHPIMIKWVADYFKAANHFKPPLYLQHQGHSRTIVGVEELVNGSTNLLLFDPGVPKIRMEQFHVSINYNLLQTMRKTVKAFRATQYQIVAVVGFLFDREMQESKEIRSTKLS